MIITGNVVAIIAGEWVGTTRASRTMMGLGLLLLGVSVAVVAIGTA